MTELTYEELCAEIERISDRLGTEPEMTLEQRVSEYERAITLTRRAKAILADSASRLSAATRVMRGES